MNTKFSYRIFLALSALLLAALACGRGNGAPPAADEPSAANQPNTAQTGDVLFQDDFQDGQPDGWEITAAWYVQQSGDIYLFEAGGSGGAWVPQGGGWSNYAFETAARLDAGSLLLSFNLNQNGRYMVRLDEMGLYLVKEYPAKNYTVLAQTGPVSLGEWHQLDMRTYNGHIQVYVDGALWVDYNDTAPLSMGTIAVTTQSGSQAAVDDVLVTKTGSLPSGVVQAPPSQGGQPELNFESDNGMSLDEIDVVVQNEQQEEGVNLPELHITSVSIMPNTPAPGTQVIVTAYVFNGGDQDAGAFTVRWYPDSSDVVGCSWEIGGLAAGASTDTGGCVYPGYGTEGTYEWRAIADADDDVNEGTGEGNNVHPGTISVGASGNGGGGGQPDLIVHGVTFDPDPATLGEPFTVNYFVKNQGQGDSGLFTFRLKFHEEAGIADCNMDVDELPAGQVDSGTCNRTVNTHPGNFAAWAMVDVEGEIAESEDGNNEASYTLSVEAAQPQDLPDLIIADVQFIAADTIQCNIRNVGSADAPAGVVVALLVNGALAGTVEVVNPIPVGTTRTRQFSNLVVPWPIDATCVADDPNAIAESEEFNNELTKNIGP